jgi:hypothetical protein
MMHLESPALTAPKHEWMSWLDQLQKMKSSDPSVAFAKKRAMAVLKQIDAREKSLTKA